jgi:UDP-N-acetylglucosamine 2-epimerase
LGHQNQLCSRKWAENVLKKLTAKVIVFDWCKLGSSPAGELANAAVQQNIPLIAVPHGLNCMTNDDRVNTQADNEPPARWGEYLRQMAFVIVQHQRHGKWMVECGVEPEKILVMGSTRFCSEWHAIYKSIIPADDGKLPKASSKLKIVYFDHTESLRLNVKAIEQALIEISKLDYVELIVKPTTGSNQYSSQAVQSISQSGVDIHSNKLVEWADVIMGSTSSILLEAFLYKKPLLYPRYFHENGQLYDQMNACIAVNDQSALLGAIEELHLSHCHIPYPEKNVEAFMTEILYGGNIDRDVLGEHRLAVIAAGTNSLRQKTDWNPAFDLSATPQLNQ